MQNDNLIGLKLDGRYEITDKIGVGGMSDVYRGRDIMENRTVAVKVLKPEFANNEEFVRCFRNESKAIAVLSHPNIVKIFDVGYEGDLQYIVMEYIDGVTLKDYIEENGLVTWRECVHYTIQILRALQLAHDRGIVHRDIKPQNVMRLSDGTIKVMDFGIARFSRQNVNSANEKTMGSVHYVSPEQARGDKTDERSDIYSVGVMMYEMLTGRKPFDGETPVEVALKHMNEDPVRPSEYVTSLQKGIEEIILRAMEKDPDKRYQSASEMIMDIEAFKQDQNITFGYLDEPVQRIKSGSKVMSSLINKFESRRLSAKKNKKEQPVPVYEQEEYASDDEEYEEKRHNYILPILCATTVTVIIVATLFFANAILGTFHTAPSSLNDYTMPNLVGMNYYDARASYPEIQLVASEEFNPDYASGIIVEQEKAEGRIVKVGDAIRVVVSKGTRMITVPDVVNYHYNSAYAALTGENLSVLRVETESDDVAAGYVVRTDPAALESIEEGSTVKVYVSIGPSTEDTTVPYLVGYTVTEAEDMLADAYLEAKIQYVESSEPENTVISQNIAEGETVTRNTVITIYVSDGTGIVADPFEDPDEGIVIPGEDIPGIDIPDVPDAPTQEQVTISVEIPANASNTFFFTAYNIDKNAEVSEQVFIDASSYAGSYLQIPVYGSGQMTVSVSIRSPRTGMRTELAVYEIDFDTGTYYCTNYSNFAFTIVDISVGF